MPAPPAFFHIIVAATLVAAGPTVGQESEPRLPLEVTTITELRFGRNTTDGVRPGQIVIEADTGRKKVLGGAIDLGGDSNRARHEINGEPNAGFVIILPKEVQLSASGGDACGVLTNFTSSPAKVGRLGPDGKATVYVGATLRFAPTTRTKNCKASFNFVVEYR